MEHDALEIFKNTLDGMKQVVREAGIDPAGIKGVSITNQRETAVIWERISGHPVANAAVWQCQRGLAFCRELKAKGLEKQVQEGQVLS